jgi:class 3 adenylate cyclase
MPELPDGVVTFVFTDVEGSTRLWEDSPGTMMEALNQHDEVIESVISRLGHIAPQRHLGQTTR